ncbi:MAG: hypothetical protein JRH20_20855, partial [Deltaproteobacteria bacterium]|nr:hypothetical protein [Deltaproteobacteria bacterium]
MPVRFSDKLKRVMQFLHGLQRGEIAEILRQHGFDEAELDKAWRLIRAAVMDELPPAPLTPLLPRKEFKELDAWENKWFPIVRATLD